MTPRRKLMDLQCILLYINLALRHKRKKYVSKLWSICCIRIVFIYQMYARNKIQRAPCLKKNSSSTHTSYLYYQRYFHPIKNGIAIFPKLNYFVVGQNLIFTCNEIPWHIDINIQRLPWRDKCISFIFFSFHSNGHGPVVSRSCTDVGL